MPIYEYICPSCNARFELRRPFSEAGEAVSCPKCQASARKLFSSFAAFSKGAEGESSSIMGDTCSTCPATSCATCDMGS
ncbi:MAG: zinc ribbon domain-containing protein [Dehalococcoidia bacterium]|nr:zinc ribbon domain-containing protein [Dehalococcoidia bacterium]MCK5653922.1 zinc ribbon domain-containing protein [Dehalococcoidia bacterium]